MGYDIQLQNANFVIPADKLDEAYRRMCELNTTHDNVKRGGSYGPGGRTDKWFSWMDSNYPETCRDAVEILAALGFELNIQDDGSVAIIGYDSKAGQEDLFIEAIAPLVSDESFLEWRGEDGGAWLEVVRNGVMEQKPGRIVYE